MTTTKGQRQPWTYRGIQIIPSGSYWDAREDTGMPIRAQSKAAVRRQVDDFLRHVEDERAAIRKEREALADAQRDAIQLERVLDAPAPWHWGQR